MNFAVGILVGMGAAALLPAVIPAVGAIVTPVAKEFVKIGIRTMERGRRAAAEAGEALEDLVAEAAAEMDESGVLDTGETEEAAQEESPRSTRRRSRTETEATP